MKFDAIEKRLTEHCDTTACVRERVEKHKALNKEMLEDSRKNLPQPLNNVRLPFRQAIR